jgi:Protein of unknown function (DUF2800)
MTQQHSFLPPSGAAAWSRCALWPTMNAQFPQNDSPESIEGTAAHWVMTELLSGRECKEGATAPNGVVISGEMIDGADLVCETVGRRMPLAHLHLEERVDAPTIHADCFGTPDIWSFFPAECHLEIVDYKFGHGFVDEYFNLQGLCYALGIIDKIQNSPVFDLGRLTVSFTVVQPRCYYRGEPVRTHTYKIAEAAEYIEALRSAAAMAYAPQPAAITGEQCSHCPGRHACPTLQKAAYSDAEYADNRQPHTLSPQAAALELRMLERAYERLGARVEGLRELTLANIKNGAPIPYYRAEAGRGRRQWNTTVEQIITIGQMLGKDLSKPGVLTPNQAQKYVDESIISAYSQHIPGSPKLIPENNLQAKRVFGNKAEG